MTQHTIKHARPDHPIHPLIVERWSPYAFDPRPVEPDKLLRCLEAARWAASSFNEQPWHFIVAPRDDTAAFDRMLGCLVEGNREWAANVGVLMITVIKRFFARNQKPNRVAEHDLGLAAGNLTLQATELGLHVHQMAGIQIDTARRTYHVPEGHDPWTAIAIGYAADPDRADNPDFAERDRTPRTRRPLPDFVFGEGWDQPAPLVS